MKQQELVEELSHYEHASWAGWMKYLFSKCIKIPDYDGLLIPLESVIWWERQANTQYKDLSEREKESDREEVRKILPVIEKYFLSSPQDPKEERNNGSI